MDCENGTDIKDFVLLDFSTKPRDRSLFFLLLLMMYSAGLLGNVIMFLLITLDEQLQTPMYFLLRSLSVIDLGYISVTMPRILVCLITGCRTISFYSCIAQVFFLYAFGVTDLLLVSVMALDRYMAICNPLHYVSVMNQKVCGHLVAWCCVISTLHSMMHAGLLLHLSYRGKNHLSHYFCDHQPLLQLSCSDTSVNEVIMFFEGGILAFGSLIFIIVTYIRIVATIMRFTSSVRRKAFSTCGSHLTLVVLFYGAIIAVYFSPTSKYSSKQGSLFGLVYTVITPMSNPYIYSLRNKEVKRAMRNLLGKGSLFLPKR